jgi:hypothetical protein
MRRPVPIALAEAAAASARVEEKRGVPVLMVRAGAPGPPAPSFGADHASLLEGNQDSIDSVVHFDKIIVGYTKH